MTSHENRPNHDHAHAHRTAKSVAIAVGAVFLLVGILGFVPGVTTNVGDLQSHGHDSEAKLLGLFQVSILHNIVHILFGVVGLAVAAATRYVPAYLIGGGVIYGILTVYGFVIDKNSDANFVPLNTADNWLHLGLTVGMIGLGVWLSKLLGRTHGDRVG